MSENLKEKIWKMKLLFLFPCLETNHKYYQIFKMGIFAKIVNCWVWNMFWCSQKWFAEIRIMIYAELISTKPKQNNVNKYCHKQWKHKVSLNKDLE